MIVTKTQPAKVIREVIAAGATDIAESRLQEISEKYDLKLFRLMQQHQVRLHFIGRLQTKKLSKVVRLCDVIQSVDSWDKAQRIDQHAANLNKTMPIFLQLNLTEEPQKGGLHPDELSELVPQIQALPNTELLGFMTIGKLDDAETTRQAFRQCKALADQYQLPEVSMGMSGDYEIALEEGATMLRMGTRLFENLSTDQNSGSV